MCSAKSTENTEKSFLEEREEEEKYTMGLQLKNYAKGKCSCRHPFPQGAPRRAARGRCAVTQRTPENP